MKFAVDRMLGTLAKWLRVLGYDTFFNKDLPGKEFALQSRREERMVLTRNSRFGEFIAPEYFYLVKAETRDEQLIEVIGRYRLDICNRLFTRCLQCNERVSEIKKKAVRGNVPEYIYKTHNSFLICSQCGNIYWEGSHYKSVLKKLRALF